MVADKVGRLMEYLHTWEPAFVQLHRNTQQLRDDTLKRDGFFQKHEIAFFDHDLYRNAM